MSPDWSAFESHMQETMKRHHIVGAAVAVSQGNQTIYEKGFGVKSLASQEPVTPDTIFGIASVSKSFTALAMTMLEDQGEISLDDPVVKHLPEFRLVGADTDSIKIRHILSHTTGLPPMTRKQDNKTFEEHLAYLAAEDYHLLGKPGEYFSYANDTFLLNGAIIQRLSGQLYRRFMTHRILDPLGMNRSTYNLEELELMGNVTTPYIYGHKEGVHQEVPWPRLGVYEVGGGVRSNVRDLLKYGALYVNEGEVSGRRLVSREGLKRMMTPVYKTGRKTHYALALSVTPDYNGVTLVQHGGGQPGVSSNFGFVPEKGLVVAVLTNVTAVPAAAIWLAAVNTALGLPLDQKISVEPQYDASSEELARFAGVYRSNEGGRLEISFKDGILKGSSDGFEFDMRASGPDTLAFQGRGQEEVVKFYFDAQGIPWAAFTHLRMLRRAD